MGQKYNKINDIQREYNTGIYKEFKPFFNIL